MVRFVVTGTEDEVRTFLESLTDVHPEESATITSEAKCKVKVPARVFQETLPAHQGRQIVTLTFTPNTGGIQIQTAAAIEDNMKERIQSLEKIFVQWYRSSDRDTFAGLVGVPPGMAPAVLAFRGEIQHSRLGGEKEVSDDSKEIPTDEAYLTAVRDVGEFTQHRLQEYPEVRARLLKVLALDFGMTAQSEAKAFMDEAVVVAVAAGSTKNGMMAGRGSS